ncbi:hypothetical protein [Holzapfeliella floricola]|uniref:HTH tetR-type domain-containing protein n=1 Tax=Holzapfeliella floricola DSM 23037 = JCM 16512 TaxID=1423744 RepID=A0A0R2DJ81_9LACO|nr:hypothetical protein [Holzapfeliella floricola]KRN03507.1 hypothetical protein FC86_GL000611 [Holzapfeliella floricola DSM 23037 = JCM 16512]
MANHLLTICNHIKSELIKESPKITVTSICKLANVHRSTFYRYFHQGLEQAYLYIFTEEVRMIFNRRSQSLDLKFKNLVLLLQTEKLLFAQLKTKIAVDLQLETLNRLMVHFLTKNDYPVLKSNRMYELVSRSNASRIIQWMSLDFNDNHENVIYDLIFSLRILEKLV